MTTTIAPPDPRPRDDAAPRRLARRGRTLSGPRFGLAPAWVLLVIGAISAVAPIAFIALTSLRTNIDYAASPLSWPHRWTLGNFRAAWSQGHFGDYALNSALVVAVSVTLVVACSAAAAFPLTFFRFPGRRALLNAVIALMILPASIMVVPTFKLVLQLHLANSYVGLTLVYVSLSTPFGIYLLANFYRSIPVELLDAASIDGATTFQSFRMIVVPMAAPALRTLTVLTALSLWNELLFGLVIMQEPGKRTLTAGVALINSNPQLGGESNVPVLAAALALVSAGPFLLYLVFNSSLSRGMTAGALK